MALTDLQRSQLIERVNNLPLKNILPYFLTGEITFSDVPKIDATRKAYIEEQIAALPNPNEQKEWKEIEDNKSNHTQDLLDKIASYIRNWEGSRPNGNHVDEAHRLYSNVENSVKRQAEDLERNDWAQVDPFSTPSLIGHLTKYPHTVHKQEIDDSIWSMINKENIVELKNYLTILPLGSHSEEAKALLNAIFDWNGVKNTNEIFTAHDYIKTNPNSPFIRQAQILLLGLKQQEIELMKSHPNEYDVDRFKKMLEENIFTDNELINANVVTPTVLDSIMHTDVKSDLPDVMDAIEKSKPECKKGFTDVYFFGIPSTGKTCVLMGMSRSSSLNINLASGGGDYAAALQQYTDVGVTVPPTPGDFFTTLEATISRLDESTMHKINLVEMSGEEFAFKIANNEERTFSFEDMATGVTELLKNDNKKVFFLIIDPTANVVRFSRRESVGYSEDTGEQLFNYRTYVVNQRTLIQKIVNIFEDPKNAEIMKRVDSIHIITTKADMLGNSIEREEKAYKIFKEKHEGDILRPLIDLGKEYNINAQTNFRPKLYTFSLGTFYVGGYYEYEPNDSDRLVKAIRNSTKAVKKKTFWNRVQDFVNK